jgi:hypothetical protein
VAPAPAPASSSSRTLHLPARPRHRAAAPWIHGAGEARAVKLPAMASRKSRSRAPPTCCLFSQRLPPLAPLDAANQRGARRRPFSSLCALPQEQELFPSPATPLCSSAPFTIGHGPLCSLRAWHFSGPSSRSRGAPPCHLPPMAEYSSHGAQPFLSSMSPFLPWKTSRKPHPLSSNGESLHGRRPAQRLCSAPSPGSAAPRNQVFPAAPPNRRVVGARQNAQQAARCSSPPVRSPLPSSCVVALVLATQPHPRRSRNLW